MISRHATAIAPVIRGIADSLRGVNWNSVMRDMVALGTRTFRSIGLAGMYEVLDLDTTLELLDVKGKRALVRKREKVRYLQNNIIAFQDGMWGDGKFPTNYRCSPGIPVDFYRPGRNTHVLISLRDVKHAGDIDDFRIEWGIHGGFVGPSQAWETEIQHRTRQIQLHVVFPKKRPPLTMTIAQHSRKRSYPLDSQARRRLPDGRWMVSWQTKNPRLNERYMFQWEW